MKYGKVEFYRMTTSTIAWMCLNAFGQILASFLNVRNYVRFSVYVIILYSEI